MEDFWSRIRWWKSVAREIAGSVGLYFLGDSGGNRFQNRTLWGKAVAAASIRGGLKPLVGVQG